MHQLGDAEAGCIEKLDECAIAKPAYRCGIGCLNEVVDLFGREELGKSRPGARCLEIFGRVLIAPALECHEPVETSDGGHGPAYRARRQTLPGQLLNEPIQIVPIQQLECPAATGGKLSELEQVTLIAFERVIGKSPLDPEMVEIDLDEPR